LIAPGWRLVSWSRSSVNRDGSEQRLSAVEGSAQVSFAAGTPLNVNLYRPRPAKRSKGRTDSRIALEHEVCIDAEVVRHLIAIEW
jgi:hypothetical protein